MNYVGSLNVMINGTVLTVPVAKVQYQNRDGAEPAGGVVENADGSLQIILDARLSDEDSHKVLEGAMEEISRRFRAKFAN